AVAARRQTAGRGRRGHVWESPEGNLYLSVLLRPRVAPTRPPGLAA
ncbi:MAG TPA: biotin--[acetyl-CoA-carboxylase] ligase, partial [Olsenella sp.]|nr:biotin--[acetyl-CoA-carboxylase] ligase [Olsenella sp.]